MKTREEKIAEMQVPAPVSYILRGFLPDDTDLRPQYERVLLSEDSNGFEIGDLESAKKIKTLLEQKGAQKVNIRKIVLSGPPDFTKTVTNL